MQLFQNFLRKIKFNCLLKRHERVLRNQKFHNFETAKTIGIIFDTQNKKTVETVENFISKIKSRVEKIYTLGYYFIKDKKTQPEIFTDFYFTNKNLNILGCPKHQALDDFFEKDLDILLLADLEGKFPLIYAFALSRASLKVAPYFDEFNFADLSIKLKPSHTLKSFFDNVENYLLEIQTSKNQ